MEFGDALFGEAAKTAAAKTNKGQKEMNVRTGNACGVPALGLAAVLTCLAAGHAHAAARTVTPPAEISRNAGQFIAKWTEFRNTAIGEYTPIFKPRSNIVLFYEAKVFSTDSGMPNGALILDVAGKVVQFTTEGESAADRLGRQVRGEFKLVRFGPRYMVAEDANGLKLAEEGRMPQLPVSASEPRLIQRPGVAFNSMRHPASRRLAFDSREVRQYASREAMYADYVINFDNYFIRTKTPTPPDFFEGVLGLMKSDPTGGGEEGGGGTGGAGGGATSAAEAIGRAKAIQLPQLKPNDPLNTLGYYSGCGGAAWANLLGWFDKNGWGPGTMAPPPVLAK